MDLVKELDGRKQQLQPLANELNFLEQTKNQKLELLIKCRGAIEILEKIIAEQNKKE